MASITYPIPYTLGCQVPFQVADLVVTNASRMEGRRRTPSTCRVQADDCCCTQELQRRERRAHYMGVRSEETTDDSRALVKTGGRYRKIPVGADRLRSHGHSWVIASATLPSDVAAEHDARAEVVALQNTGRAGRRLLARALPAGEKHALAAAVCARSSAHRFDKAFLPRLLAYVVKNSGQRIEQIAKAIGNTTKELAWLHAATLAC